MAEETRVARTSSISGVFHVGELVVTPEGTELTKKQWITVRDAAFANGVRVSLDDEFPPDPVQSTETETEAEAPVAEEKQAPEQAAETSTAGSGRGRSGRG